jgi:hypothetical protein
MNYDLNYYFSQKPEPGAAAEIHIPVPAPTKSFGSLRLYYSEISGRSWKQRLMAEVYNKS